MTDPSILTIIVPAYNEEARIAESLDKIAAYITETTHPVDVIVVNNNSTDRTSEIVNTYAERYSFIQQLHQPVQGKGAALKMGIMAGRGKYLFLCDADLSMPIEEVEKFIPPALGDYDIAIASREIPGSNRVGEPEYRHLMGRVYNLVVRLFAIPNIQDTQCGFKSYRRDIAQEVFTLQTINGWGFDVEVLYIALHHGYKIIEVPITWHYMANSRISPIKDSLQMFTDVFRVRLNAAKGRYDGAKAYTNQDARER